MSRLPLQKTSHKKAQNTPHLFCELRAFLWLNSFSLKREPQSKLDLPRRRRRIDDASGRPVSCACGSRKNRHDHVAEIRMVLTLNASARNCKLVRSVRLNCFFIAKSRSASPGPITAFFDRFPNVPAGGSIKAQGSNHRDGVPNSCPGATLSAPRPGMNGPGIPLVKVQPAVVPLVWIFPP